MELITFLALIVIVGALVGGKSLGGTIRLGCLTISALTIGLLILVAIMSNGSEEIPENEKENQSSPALLMAIDTCQSYSQPDINSAPKGKIQPETQFEVSNPLRYKYFYKITTSIGETVYVQKSCLQKLD